MPRLFRGFTRNKDSGVEMDAPTLSELSEDTLGSPPVEDTHQLHRILPILSGLLCPFAVLLEIPG